MKFSQGIYRNEQSEGIEHRAFDEDDLRCNLSRSLQFADSHHGLDGAPAFGIRYGLVDVAEEV
jgi:hypothetical protein